MASVNKVVLIGRLGKNIDRRQTGAGSSIANLTVATDRRYKDGQGNAQTETEWHSVVFFEKTAEIAGQYLRKGSLIYIEGRLHTRKYTDKQGIERYATDIIGETLQFLDRKKRGRIERALDECAQSTGGRCRRALLIWRYTDEKEKTGKANRRRSND